MAIATAATSAMFRHSERVSVGEGLGAAGTASAARRDLFLGFILRGFAIVTV
jgi:hypothetical protein